MSWQTYVDDHLMSEITPGHSLTAAAIVGHDGSVWAQSAKFPEVKPEEHAAILEGFDEGSALAKLGFSLGGDKYSVVQGEPGIVIRGKKTKGGITIRKTSTALVIGIYDEPTTAAECNVAVERLGDYLAEQGI